MWGTDYEKDAAGTERGFDGGGLHRPPHLYLLHHDFSEFQPGVPAQNYIAHNLLQASSLIAAESYEQDVSALAGAGTELSKMFDNFSDMFKSSSQIQAEYTADQAKSTQALIADKMAEAAGGQSILEGNLKSFRVEDEWISAGALTTREAGRFILWWNIR